MPQSLTHQYILNLDQVSNQDVGLVGGKNASLGEMMRTLRGIPVPHGFAVTAAGYWAFLEHNNLSERISKELETLEANGSNLSLVGQSIRSLILEGTFPRSLEEAILKAYEDLSEKNQLAETSVAVRSSATAEDLPEASFAGQQETYLNVRGPKDLLNACRKCFASLFTDRAITYRAQKGFQHLQVALSIGVQKMIRSDLGSAGVMFTIDPDTGFPKVVVINAAWGLGESVVKGSVNPDQYMVFKALLEDPNFEPIIEKTLGDKAQKMIYGGGDVPARMIQTPPEERSRFVLTDGEVLQLAAWACQIEDHYGKPMDVEWARDGSTGDLWILQARPETVHTPRQTSLLKTYHLKEQGDRLVSGLAIGTQISTGLVFKINSPKDIDRIPDGSMLVTEMTDPDWVPAMKKVAGIITESGGRTCHAAIVSRELGLPALVGAHRAREILQQGQPVTLSCAEGEMGWVYQGHLDYQTSEIDIESIPEVEPQIMLILASPMSAFRWWRLPCDGIGLARMEFIISDMIKIHPMALVRFHELEDEAVRDQIAQLTQGYAQKSDYFVDQLSRAVAKIAASQYPRQVILRMSDFKTNEYADLIGGSQFEPHENNPMLGFRGACRYYSERYAEGFELECQAVKRVRDQLGFSNLDLMIPFCRTLTEADQVLEVLEKYGLARGANGLRIYVMCELPSNVLLAREFGTRFDGLSIGSNDLTQLTLGVDRDSAELEFLFDERNDAVKAMIRMAIREAKAVGASAGICGQAPSDFPEFADFLVQEGIDSISVNPDRLVTLKQHLSQQATPVTSSPPGGKPSTTRVRDRGTSPQQPGEFRTQ